MRRVTDAEVQDLARLFLTGNLIQPVEISVDAVAFSVTTVGTPWTESDWQMQYRTMAGSDEGDAVQVNGRRGWLDLGVGQWSDQPNNEQVVLSSNRKELDPRFGQINLNLSLTDGRTVYLVKNLSKDGGSGTIRRLYGGASGPEMQAEREARRTHLITSLGNETTILEDQEWLIVHALPMRVKRRQIDAVFTEALVQILRYAAQVERLRHGAQIDERVETDDVVGVPRQLSAAERKLLETEAMMVVRAHLEARGYRVRDVASRQSYDFEARRDNDVLFVEVKGTTSRPWSVELTAAEYRMATRERDRYSMLVVIFADIDHLSESELVEVGNPVTDSGYEVAPVRYRVREK